MLRNLCHFGAGAVIGCGMVDREKGIISDSKSGVSGAGKEATARTHFVSVADNLSAYSVFGHRHVGEILEQLKLSGGELIFTPHLLPIPRGILSTIYVHLKRETKASEVESCFQDFYEGKPWVRVFATPKLPKSSFHLTPTTATWVSVWRKTGGGWCWCHASTTSLKARRVKQFRT